MTAKLLNDQHLDDEHDGNKPGERRSGDDDDDSSGDDESVSDDESHSSSESSTSKESPPRESMNADRIRQNARELLLTSPDGSSKKKRDKASSITTNNNTTADKANGYRSYHDAPDVRTSPTTSQFTNSNANTTPPWSSHNENNEGLSMTDVASMTFTCVAHCLTEGYRAASNYYGGYEESQYLSASGGQNNGPHNNYQQAGGYHDAAYNNNNNSTTPHNNYDDDRKTKVDVTSKNGYSDSGYQTKSSGHSSQPREVMDRGVSQMSGQDSTEQTKDEWASVQVPSSYQGGRVGGSGN